MNVKICNKCTDELDIEQFGPDKKSSDGRRHACKQCRSDAHKIWVRNNRDQYLQAKRNRNKQRRVDNRAYIKEFLQNNPCVVCSESRIECLDFDHLFDKKFNISEMIGRHSITTIFEEIKKCQVLCANCHRVKTAQQQSWYMTK